MKISRVFTLFSATLFAGLSTLATYATASDTVTGFLYTTLNGEGTNKVIAIERMSDGSLGAQTTYSTGSMGGANRAAGGDAAGDFDAQGALQIIDDYLLAVNAGGNTISVFSLDRQTGTLARKANVNSMGTRPVSIAYMQKPGSKSDYWVVIGNQWNNPNVQKGGKGEGPIEMYPDAAFHADGGGHTKVLKDRNIHLFSFNSKTGTLKAERALDTYAGTNGGPSTVAFSPDGKKLGVSTWGIAHFSTETPTHQKPSRVYVYDFDKKTGNVSGRRYYEEKGVSGSIGFSWDLRTPTLFVSNFNLTQNKRDHSLTVLRDDGRNVKKVAAFGTGEGSDIDEACWTTLNQNGTKLYVSSFGGNLISEFNVDRAGNVSKVGKGSETAFARRKSGTPAGDTKDMLVSSDGRHLYVLGAYQTFTVTCFDVSPSGGLTFNEEVKIKDATISGPGAYNFLGLVGLDLPKPVNVSQRMD